MGYSVDAELTDCYEGTSCLINKFNITDESKLSSIEAAITLAKISQLEKNPIIGNYDLKHYKDIHKFIFEDIYDWAGEFRTTEISKKGTSFAKVEDIEPLCTACFNRLKGLNYFTGVSKTDFIEYITDFYCVTNKIHPFREGNGRTQRVFISQLIRKNGYEIDFSAIDTDELLIATIQASCGVRDNLLQIFSESIH